MLAREAGAFTIADVARGIHDKLVRRHPHVFGSVSVDGSDDVVANWEQIKRDEKGTGSLVSGLTAGLPSLLGLPKLFRKADSIGLDPGAGSLARAERALRALDGPVSHDPEAGERAVADVLAAVVAIAWERGVDPEAALRGWARRYRDQFVAMEQRAEAAGIDLASAPAGAALALWDDSVLEDPGL